MVTLNCKSISQTQPSDWVTTNNICMFNETITMIAMT